MFESALYTWCDVFLCRKFYLNNKKPDTSLILTRYRNSLSVKILRLMKELVLTLCRNDSAYLEFLNVLMYSLTMRMNKEYPSSVDHLLYTNQGINDVKYFMILNSFHVNMVNKNEVNSLNPKD